MSMDETSKPTPDPTVLTTQQLMRTVDAEKQWVIAQFDVIRERLAGIDKATEVLAETVNRAPTEVQREIAHVRELLEERFVSVATQFRERDTRQERESRDNKVAVDAAFAAQKEAASEQNKSNTLAISKSETATTETINKLGDLFRTTTDALSGRIDDVKDRVGAIESIKVGASEAKTGTSANIGLIIAVAVLVLGVVTVLANVLSAHG